MLRALWVAALCGLVACAPRTTVRQEHPYLEDPPSLILGEFEDDYGIRYSITKREWHQLPDARYRIVLWRPDAQYLIAQNDEANPSDPGMWTRIDWMALSDMPLYEWAFCMSAYDAPTADEAERESNANREKPRTGCNGFPFSRMRRDSGDR